MSTTRDYNWAPNGPVQPDGAMPYPPPMPTRPRQRSQTTIVTLLSIIVATLVLLTAATILMVVNFARGSQQNTDAQCAYATTDDQGTSINWGQMNGYQKQVANAYDCAVFGR